MSNVRCQSPTLSLNERSRQALSSVVLSFGAPCLGIVIVAIIVPSYPSASRAHPLPHVLPVPDCACGTGAARWVSITQVGLASSSPTGSVLVSTTVWGAPWSWLLSVLLGFSCRPDRLTECLGRCPYCRVQLPPRGMSRWLTFVGIFHQHHHRRSVLWLGLF